MMNGHEKSDPAIVAVKPTNEAGRPGEEPAEPRAGTEGNADQTDTLPDTEPGRRVTRLSLSKPWIAYVKRPTLRAGRGCFAYTPEVGAVCGKAARTVLCGGGRAAMRVPTAIVAALLAMTWLRLIENRSSRRRRARTPRFRRQRLSVPVLSA